ncbi:hypothetical protein GCM10020000_76870 [Streptomyces olivoverticillatus]
MSGGAGDQPERDPAAQQPRVRVHRLLHRLRSGKCGAGVRQDRPAYLGQSHRPAGAVEQGLPQLPLQLADLGAETGLGQMQPGGGSGETALLDDADEVAQLTKLHK